MGSFDPAWNKLSPEQKRIEGDAVRTIILAKCGEVITSIEVAELIGKCRSVAGRYLRQLEAENKIRRIDKYKLNPKKTHWLDGYIAIGSLDYKSPEKNDPSDIEGVTQPLLHWMGYGETKLKGSKRDLKHYKNELETEGTNWNPNSQKCLGGFSYGVGSSLL